MGVDSYIKECENYCAPCLFEQFCYADNMYCLGCTMVLMAKDYILRGEM